METLRHRELDCRWEVTELVSGSTEDWSTQVSRLAWGHWAPGWAGVQGRPELVEPGHGHLPVPTGADGWGSTCGIWTGKQKVFRSFPGPNPLMCSLGLRCPETLHLLFSQALGLETLEIAQAQGPESRTRVVWRASHFWQPVVRGVDVYPRNWDQDMQIL